MIYGGTVLARFVQFIAGLSYCETNLDNGTTYYYRCRHRILWVRAQTQLPVIVVAGTLAAELWVPPLLSGNRRRFAGQRALTAT